MSLTLTLLLRDPTPDDSILELLEAEVNLTAAKKGVASGNGSGSGSGSGSDGTSPPPKILKAHNIVQLSNTCAVLLPTRSWSSISKDFVVPTDKADSDEVGRWRGSSRCVGMG